MPVRLLLEMLSYAPILNAGSVDCPVQFVYGVHDNGIDPGSIRSAAAKIKQSETVSLTINHFEGLNRFYRDRIAAFADGLYRTKGIKDIVKKRSEFLKLIALAKPEIKILSIATFSDPK